MHSPMGSRRGSAGVCDTCGVVVTCDFRPIHFTTRSRSPGTEADSISLPHTLYFYGGGPTSNLLDTLLPSTV